MKSGALSLPLLGSGSLHQDIELLPFAITHSDSKHICTITIRLNIVVMKENKNAQIIVDRDSLQQNALEARIITIRGLQVMLDRDLAEFYGIPTYRLNEQVKRNIKRFPNSFRFQLTERESAELIANCDRLSTLKHSSNLPYVFTEQGVAMLSAVLHSPEAVEISIRIIEAFVAMRHFLLANAQVFQRLDKMELKQLETDHKIEQVFAKLEETAVTPKQGIFFDGQIYDAYEFICGLIKSAMSRIVLIDNYIDETVLTMLDKRETGVLATIYTKQISQQLELDLTKHNAQYTPIEVHPFNKAHDRFLIIDERIYHIGASLKDLGNKWFAFSIMNDLSPDELLSKL